MGIEKLEVEFLHECFIVDHDEGLLLWKTRPLKHFTSDRSYKSWNTQFAGKIAGNIYKKNTKYEVRQVGINEESYLAHIVIWKMFHRINPSGDITHKDGNQLNNKIENLEDQPHKINMRFQKKKSSNTSGMTGVYWSMRRDKWIVQPIRRKGSTIKLRFHQADCLLEAVAARLAHERDMEMDPLHGK